MPDLPVLLAAAVAAVLLLAVALPRLLRARRTRSPEDLGLPVYRPRTEEEELRELGIGEVRVRTTPPPRDAYAPPEAPAPEEPPPPPRPEPIRDEPVRAEPVQAEPVRTAAVVTSAVRRARRDEELSPEEATRAAQEHLLNALLLSAGAHTVALLREETGTHRRYHIERIVSRNAFARPHGHFVSRTSLLGDTPKRRTTLHRVGHGHPFPPEALGYYRETLTGLREALATPLTLGGAAYVLVADAMQDGRLGGRRVKTLAEATARLLENTPVPDASEPAFGDGLPALVDAPAQPAATAALADELAKAGASGLGFVLAHVEPHGSGDDRLDGMALEQAEAALRSVVVDGLPDDARVERFGDLTYAVFTPDTSAALDGWIEGLYGRLAAAYPGGRVAVGAVVHDGVAPMTTDDLRGHALTALAASYEEGTPVILG